MNWLQVNKDMNLFIYLFIYLFVYLFIYLFIYLSIYFILFLYEGPDAIVECGLISVLINKLSDNTDEIKVSENCFDLPSKQV